MHTSKKWNFNALIKHSVEHFQNSHLLCEFSLYESSVPYLKCLLTFEAFEENLVSNTKTLVQQTKPKFE